MSILEQLIERNIPLYDEKLTLMMLRNAPRQTQLLQFVIQQNYGSRLNYGFGILPKKITVHRELKLHQSDSSANNLIKKKFVAIIPLNQTIKFYGTYNSRGKKWEIPVSLEPTLRNDLDNMRGKVTGSLSYHEMIEREDIRNSPHYYIALITRDGVPVFKGIFPNLPYEKLEKT